MLWQDEIKVSLRCMHSWFIGVDIRDTSGEKWRLSQKSKTWDLLRGLKERDHIPWLILGDFNEVLYTSEKNASDAGYGYTWPNRKHEDKFVGESLERGQVSREWLARFPDSTVREPPVLVSKNFKLEAKWLHVEEFDEVMCES
ncbi:Nocturnin [Bienertia sinuspersici]